MVAELAYLFLEDAPQLLKTLRNALANGNGEEAQRAAHTLEGTSASLGAIRLSQLCEKLEASLPTSSPEELKTMLEQVETAYVQVKLALQTFVAESGAIAAEERD